MKVILAAGGTGGHIFPAQAFAEELIKRGSHVQLFTDARGQNFDAKLERVVLPVRPTYGSVARKLIGLFSLIPAFSVAFAHMIKNRPDVVVGFGGYVSAPTLWAALVLRIPVVLHQADAILGRINRWCAPFANLIASSFPMMRNMKPAWNKKLVHVGLPLRADIEPMAYKQIKDQLNILVIGGSQGAQVFSKLMPQAIAQLSTDDQQRLHIVQQCRKEDLDQARDMYGKTASHVTLDTFFSDMPARYENADLVVSRAGASSVMEAAMTGRPAILVPYPYAMDNHQFYNAQIASEAGGAWCFAQEDLDPDKMAIFLQDLLNSPWKLKSASDNIQKIAVNDAAQRLADVLEPLSK